MAIKQNYLQFLHDEVWGDDEVDIDETQTQEYLQKLQDEALADRAWIKPEKLDGWDYQLFVGENKVNDLKDLQNSFFYAREYFASGKLEKWLENKALSTKDEQESEAFNRVLNRVREIPMDSTRLEAMKALYQIIFDENEILPQMEAIFECVIRWGALENEHNQCVDTALVLSKELCCAWDNDSWSEEQERAREWLTHFNEYTSMIDEMQDEILNKAMPPEDIDKKYDNSQISALRAMWNYIFQMLDFIRFRFRINGKETEMQFNRLHLTQARLEKAQEEFNQLSDEEKDKSMQRLRDLFSRLSKEVDVDEDMEDK